MSSKTQVLEAALELTEEERLEVARRLLDSVSELLEPAVQDAWRKELDLRFDEIRSGKAELVDWEDVRRNVLGR